MSHDVAIIGAGIVGAACAASLSASGLRVLVLESNGIATGTTAAGMGHIVLMDDSEPQMALTGYSRKLWNELGRELPADSEYDHCGTIWIAADDEEMAEVGAKDRFMQSTDPTPRSLTRGHCESLNRICAKGLPAVFLSRMTASSISSVRQSFFLIARLDTEL